MAKGLVRYHPGDVLRFHQYSDNAMGGIMLWLNNGCTSNGMIDNVLTDTTDQDGYSATDYARTDGAWHHRIIDLSAWAGHAVTALNVGIQQFGPAGQDDVWMRNAAIVRADGSVLPIFNGSPVSMTGWYGTVLSATPVDTCVVSGLTLDFNSIPLDDTVNTTYYLDDHLGTAQMELTSGGWPVWQGQFTPFGAELPDGNTAMHYKFTGKERDSESGLDYFGARYYASSMGRWMSPDWADKPEAVPYSSLDNPQSLNLYSYVLNNPLSKADADGHWPDCSWCSKAWSGVTGVVGGVLNVVPQTINAAGQLQNAMMSPFTSYRVDMLPEIQADAHTSQTGLDIGNAAVTAYPLAAAAVEVRTAGMVIGEVRAATAGEAAAKAAVPDSIPAGPGARPSPTQQGAINQMGDAHGCSTCGTTNPGTKTGNWVGDHQPPTKQNPTNAPQVYKPQCLPCSQQQGVDISRANRAARKTQTPQ